MRIAYFGSPTISAQLLKEILVWEGIEVSLVISNPDKTQKRSKSLVPTPVSKFVKESMDKKITLLCPQNINTIETEFQNIDIDLFVIFAYGKILPNSIIQIPKKGAINLHASLLPELRGATPLQSAILQGFTKSGWTVQYINSKIDQGSIISQVKYDINPEENAGELMERVLPLGFHLVKKAIDSILENKVNPMKQKEEASYCTKLITDTARINWEKSSTEIHNMVRAYNPKPIAWTLLENKKLKIYKTLAISSDTEIPTEWKKAKIGSLGIGLEKQLWIKCKEAPLQILELQLEGRKKISAKDFLNGYRGKNLKLLN